MALMEELPRYLAGDVNRSVTACVSGIDEVIEHAKTLELKQPLRPWTTTFVLCRGVLWGEPVEATNLPPPFSSLLGWCEGWGCFIRIDPDRSRHGAIGL